MSTEINIGKKITVQDEGSTITNDVNQLNFTGAGVTASASGNNVTVNIAGGGGGSSFIIKNSTDAPTNSVTIIELYSVLIPANTFTVGDFLNYVIGFRRTGTTGNNISMRCYINTSNSISGATQLSNLGVTGTTTAYARFERTLIIKSPTNTESVNTLSTFISDVTSTSSLSGSSNIDWTVDQYFIVGGSVNNAADTLIFSNILLQKL